MKRKVYIVTGANRGLGKAFVDVLMQKKDSFVISISRSMSEEQRGYSPEKFYFLETDLSNDGITEKLTVLKNMIDKEDIWFINNASIIEPIIKIADLSEEAIDKTMAVNTILWGKYGCFRKLFNHQCTSQRRNSMSGLIGSSSDKRGNTISSTRNQLYVIG